jgi:hypothetical protein
MALKENELNIFSITELYISWAFVAFFITVVSIENAKSLPYESYLYPHLHSLFTIVKIWNQPKCLHIYMCIYIYDFKLILYIYIYIKSYIYIYIYMILSCEDWNSTHWKSMLGCQNFPVIIKLKIHFCWELIHWHKRGNTEFKIEKPECCRRLVKTIVYFHSLKYFILHAFSNCLTGHYFIWQAWLQICTWTVVFCGGEWVLLKDAS